MRHIIVEEETPLLKGRKIELIKVVLRKNPKDQRS